MAHDMRHPGAMADDALLTISQVVDRYDVSQRTVRRWLAEGQIPGARRLSVGRGEAVWRIPEQTAAVIWSPRQAADVPVTLPTQTDDGWQAALSQVQASADALERRLQRSESDLEAERSERQRLEVALARSEAVTDGLRRQVESSENAAQTAADRVISVEAAIQTARDRERELLDELAAARNQMSWRARRRTRKGTSA